MIKKVIYLLLFFCCLSNITGCGQSGRLYLPEQATHQHRETHDSLH